VPVFIRSNFEKLAKVSFLKHHFVLAILVMMFLVPPALAYAENESLSELSAVQKTLYQKASNEGSGVQRITRKMVAVDATTLKSARYTVDIWGVKKIFGGAGLFDLQARDVMDGLIGVRPVSCRVVTVTTTVKFNGRCLAENGEDIGLALIQKGLAVVDRAAIYKSQFEEMYSQAEGDARKQRLGVWAEMAKQTRPSVLPKGLQYLLEDTGPLVYFVGPLLMMVLIVWLVKRGFDRVIEGQQKIVMQSQEKQDALQARERMVLAASIDAELVENKAKIEAYLNIYGEMLADLTDPATVPKYQKTGDSIALHPSLSRTMFEGNTNKLSVLGMKLASEISRLYSNFHIEMAYENLDPAMPIEQAKSLVSNAVNNAVELLPQIDNVVEQIQAVAQATQGHER